MRRPRCALALVPDSEEVEANKLAAQETKRQKQEQQNETKGSAQVENIKAKALVRIKAMIGKDLRRLGIVV